MNKKAVEVNVSTIIVVILALLVLVVLALYFTGGMKYLWSRITPVPAAYSQTDVEYARSLCALYCSSRDKTSYCTHEFTIRKNNEKGETISTEKHYCYDSVIKGFNEQECKEAGYESNSCD